MVRITTISLVVSNDISTHLLDIPHNVSVVCFNSSLHPNGLLVDFRLQVYYFLVNLSNVVVVGYFQICIATLHTDVCKFFGSILTDVSLI